jgi:hypothetical protein
MNTTFQEKRTKNSRYFEDGQSVIARDYSGGKGTNGHLELSKNEKDKGCCGPLTENLLGKFAIFWLMSPLSSFIARILFLKA